MLENVKVLCHSSIKFEREKIIYFDPFKIDKKYRDADIIFITHSHYDHFSAEDILKVRNENTMIVIPSELYINCFNLGLRDLYLPLIIKSTVYLHIWCSWRFPQIKSPLYWIIGLRVNDKSLLNLHGYTSYFLYGSGGIRKSGLWHKVIWSIIFSTKSIDIKVCLATSSAIVDRAARFTSLSIISP